MRVGIHEVKTNLSKLIPAVQTGEDVIITKAGKPVARLVPFIEKNGHVPWDFISARLSSMETCWNRYRSRL